MKYFLFLIFVVLLFINNDILCLWEQDEAAYAGFAWNMLESGNFLIPDFEWSWPHRKSPFHFWLIALSYKLFGHSEFTTRIPSVLAILGTALQFWFIGKRLFPKDIAKWSTIVFMSTLILPLYGKISMTDATLLFFYTLSLFSVIGYLYTHELMWLIVLFIGISLGGLTKGPPIFIVSIGAIGVYLLFHRERKYAFRLLITIVMAFLPLFVWGYLAWQNDGGTFIKWLFDWYILKRTSGTVNNQTGFIGYYLAVFLICFFPWLLFIPNALKGMFTAFRKKQIKERESVFYKLSFYWILCGWIFYEFIPSKLPSYAFAAIPVWTIFIAKSVLAFQISKWTISNAFLRLFGFVLIIVGALGVAFLSLIPFEELRPSIVLICILFVSFGLLHFVYNKVSYLNSKLPLLSIVLAFTMNFIAWGVAIPAMEQRRSFPKQIATKIANMDIEQKSLIFSNDYSMSSLPVYLSWNGFKYSTIEKERCEELSLDSMNRSDKNLFMLQTRNLPYMERVQDSFNLTLLAGWVSDRGIIDTFFIAERIKAL